MTIAYIGGGSKAWANVLMTDLALEEKLSGTVRLYDINYEAANQNAQVGNRITARTDAKGKWKYEAVKTMTRGFDRSGFCGHFNFAGHFQ